MRELEHHRRVSNKCVSLSAMAMFSLVSMTPHAVEPTSSEGTLLIRGGWLFDARQDVRQRNAGLLVKGEKIVSLSANDDVNPATAGQVIELDASDTVLPGFIDLHAHYNLDLVDKGRVEEVVYNGIVFLANGVTSTWSAGEYYPERVIAHRNKINEGLAIGPRLFASGPYFGAFRCEYAVKVAEDECIAWPNDITEAEIRREVDYWAEQGVISIKIKQANPAEASILIDQAHKNGMTATAHLANYNVEYDVSLKDAILMGIDRIEHQLTLGSGGARSAEMNDMIKLALTHQVHYDANLQMYGGILQRQQHAKDMIWTDESQYFTPYTQTLLKRRGPPPPESDHAEFSQRVVELKALHDVGGAHLLVVGTDEPVYTSLLPGFAYHRELLAMKNAGLPEAAVLKAATINGAQALGIDDRLGSIETGKLADLVIVKGDPLSDIKAARNIRSVIKNGDVYDPGELLQSAVGKIGPQSAADHGDWELTVAPLQRITAD